MAKIAGYGIKVETDTGRFVWLTEKGTTTVASSAMKFESEDGANIYRNMLARNNPHANLITQKLSK